MNKRKFMLLTKVVFFYLLITMASFIISALILQSEANKHMHNIMETRFQHRQHYIRRLMKHNPERLSRLSHTKVTEIPELPSNTNPIFRDTLMLNEQTQQEEIFRKMISYISLEDRHYKIETSKEAGELYRFRDDIFHVILPIFGVLVIIVVVTNYLLSGYLLEPFRKILKQMSSYQIGKTPPLENIRTSTREFHQLKTFYDKMQKRIEDDYYQLKEYTENMSHELQTPLSIIQNKTESLLSENSLTPEQANKLKVIYDENQQLSKLGIALNLITKIENNEFQNIRNVHTAPVIRNHLDKIEEMVRMKQLTIETDLSEEHTFSIDPGLLDILIRNLLKNALRYSIPNSTVIIESAGDKLNLSNRGSSLDFPENEIFTRFTKGNGSHSVGLGLAIVKKICQVSRLQIRYENEGDHHRFEICPALGQS